MKATGINFTEHRVALVTEQWRSEQAYADSVRGHSAVTEWLQASKAEAEVISHAEDALQSGVE